MFTAVCVSSVIDAGWVSFSVCVKLCVEGTSCDVEATGSSKDCCPSVSGVLSLDRLETGLLGGRFCGGLVFFVTESEEREPLGFLLDIRKN